MGILNVIRENSERAFQAFLSVTTPEKTAGRAWCAEDALIEKNAGFSIFNPTIENVENFVLKYLNGELKFAENAGGNGKNILVQPKSFDSQSNKFIKDASGLVSFPVAGHEVELPFLITDGEFLPFDVIQVGKERVPYSRENLQKIYYGLLKYEKEKTKGGVDEFKPFLGLAQPVNPTSSVGFLGDVLRIQEQHSNRGATGGAYYVTAAEELEEVLEKVAKMDPVCEAEWQAIERSLLNQAIAAQRRAFEKHAQELGETSDEKVASVYDAVDKVAWKNANDCKHGQVIHIPEIKEDELSMVRGIVLSQFEAVSFITAPAKVKVVVTEDGRVQLLQPGDKMLCVLPTTDEALAIPTVELGALEVNDVFMAFNGDQVIYPQSISSVRKRLLGTDYGSGISEACQSSDIPYNTLIVKVFHLGNPIRQTSELYESGFFGNASDAIIRVVTMDGTKFGEMDYVDFIKAQAKNLGYEDNMNALSAILNRSDVTSFKDDCRVGHRPEKNKVLVSDEKTAVIKIKPQMICFVKSVEDIRAFENRAMSPDYDFTKTASAKEYVEINSASKDDHTFNFKVCFIDRATKSFQPVTRRFAGVNYEKGREILKAIGFSLTQVAELMTQADRLGHTHADLPENGTPDMLQGSMVKGKASQLVHKMRTSIFNPGFTDQMSGEILGRTLENGLAEPPEVTKKHIVSALRKKQAEASALTASFEKQAIEQESDTMHDLAALMALTAHLDDKLASYFSCGDEYPQLRKVGREILAHQDYLEKTAYDLIALKTRQAVTGEEVAPFGHLGRAVQTLDHLYKMAYYMAM